MVDGALWGGRGRRRGGVTCPLRGGLRAAHRHHDPRLPCPKHQDTRGRGSTFHPLARCCRGTVLRPVGLGTGRLGCHREPQKRC